MAKKRIFTKEQQQKETLHSKMARDLHTALKAKNLIKREANLTRWALVFKELLRENKEDELMNTLRWYIANLGGKYVPHAYSAQGFSERLGKIKQAMKKSLPPPEQKMEPLATKLADIILGRRWPAGQDKKLPRVIQKNFIAYRGFRSRILEILEQPEELPAPGRPHLFMRNMLRAFAADIVEANRLCDEFHFFRAWFLEAHEKLDQWRHWNGWFDDLIWSPTCKHMMYLGCDWSTNWSGNSDWWFKLLTAVGEEIPEEWK